MSRSHDTLHRSSQQRVQNWKLYSWVKCSTPVLRKQHLGQPWSILRIWSDGLIQCVRTLSVARRAQPQFDEYSAIMAHYWQMREKRRIMSEFRLTLHCVPTSAQSFSQTRTLERSGDAIVYIQWHDPTMGEYPSGSSKRWDKHTDNAAMQVCYAMRRCATYGPCCKQSLQTSRVMRSDSSTELTSVEAAIHLPWCSGGGGSM